MAKRLWRTGNLLVIWLPFWTIDKILRPRGAMTVRDLTDELRDIWGSDG